MNIMLMSVTQRTREIGVRKAIGARRKDIVWQFLLEAALLTTIGGMLGVSIASFLGLVLAYLCRTCRHSAGVGSLLGPRRFHSCRIVFGIWPAVKAASLDPVDSLRYE